MAEALFTLEAEYNRRNRSRCELYPDHIHLTTECTGGLMPVYDNRERDIALSEIEDVVISNGGMKYFIHHPNAIHFKTRDARRTLDDLFRDNRFHSNQYIDEGVQQFCPKNETDLAEKIGIAAQMKAYIEQWQREQTQG